MHALHTHRTAEITHECDNLRPTGLGGGPQSAGTLTGVYRFAFRARWLVGSILVLLAAAVCIRLGMWQLDRLEQKRDHNRRVEQRSALPVAALDEVVAADASEAAGDAVEFRQVEVVGRYDTDHEVLVRSRSLDGRPGQHVVTPLVVGEEMAVLVNRGFVPFVDPEAPLPAVAEPPDGEVRVEGLVRASERRGSFGPRDAGTGRLTHVSRVDVPRIQEQVPYDLFPVFVQLSGQDPAVETIPVALPPPELGEGPHLSYAVQWFIFATVFLAGWPVLVWRTAAERAGRGVGGDQSPPPPSPPPSPPPAPPPARIAPSSSLQVGQTG